MTARFLARRAAIGAISAAAIVLAAVPQATAAEPWSAPQTVPGAYMLRWQPLTAPMPGFALKRVNGLFGFTPGGLGIAVLGRAAGGQGIAQLNAESTAFGVPAASTFGGLAPSQMALYAREGVMVAGAANAKGDPRSPLNAEILLDAAISRRAGGGRFSTRQVVGKGIFQGMAAPAVVTALTANASGDAAAVVSVPVRGTSRPAGYRSQLFTRRRGQSSFRKVMTLGQQTTGSSPAALAVNAPGDVLVAWDDRSSVFARIVTARGTISAQQRLGQGGSAFVYGGRMSATMDGSRRAVVAWVAQRVAGESATAGGPGTVSYAYASPYKRFGSEHVVQRNLPRGADLGIRGPGVSTILLRNKAVVAWSGYSSGRYAVRALDIVSGQARNRTDLSAAGTNAQLCGLAAGPRGGVIATWSTSVLQSTPSSAPPLGYLAAARAASATAWGTTETITGAAPTPDALPAPNAPLGVDPLSGQAVMLWSTPATQPPGAPPVLFSTRAAAG